MKEIQLIQEIRERAGRPGKAVKIGIGDDCAVLEYSRTHYLLWASDMLVEGTHFVPGKAPYKKIGRKAVAVNISDIAAMGGVPKYITVSLGVPRRRGSAAVRGIYNGIFGICKEHDIEVVGGDTNASGKLVIDVSVLGLVEKKRLVTRRGAKKGDLVLITGPVRNGRKEHMDFMPRVEEARFLTRRYKVSSMIDVSDGIAVDMGRVCRESGVGCLLYADAIPLSKGLGLKDALYYGESFELLFTMNVKEARKLFLDAKSRREWPGYFIIGEITPEKQGLCLVEKEGRSAPLKMEGFRHL